MAKRKPAPKALAADDFEPDAIMLRTTDKDGKDYSGFQWPMQVGAVVVCPDWNNKAECGGGLHGYVDGLGNRSNLSNNSDALWWIVGIVRSRPSISMAKSTRFRAPR